MDDFDLDLMQENISRKRRDFMHVHDCRDLLDRMGSRSIDYDEAFLFF